MDYIYLDNAATTPVCESAKKAINENIDNFFNPSSSYDPSIKIKIKIEEARESIANIIGAKKEEIFFTSGGSESNSWVFNNRIHHSISSNIEHSSVNTSYIIPVEKNGIVNCGDLGNDFRHNIFGLDLMSCMTINNEIGTIQPIKELCKIAHKYNMLFHTDAVQAMGHIDINVKDTEVDFMSASAHKFGGIKGCGFLYIKEDKEMWLSKLIYGGKQEFSKRGGTENVIGILSMAESLKEYSSKMKEDNEKILYLSKMIKDSMLNIYGVSLNGSDKESERYSGNLNFKIDRVNGSNLVALANQFGIYISSGSACHEGESKPSKVLKAIGLSNNDARNSIRISIGKQNTEEEIKYVCEKLPYLINILRGET